MDFASSVIIATSSKFVSLHNRKQIKKETVLFLQTKVANARGSILVFQCSFLLNHIDDEYIMIHLATKVCSKYNSDFDQIKLWKIRNILKDKKN